MKLVVVGGQARKVGKTSLVAGLIRELDTIAWTAVKISQHDDDGGSQNRQPAEDLPAHIDFLWSEEKDPKGHGDTSRYLAAGARRALWFRVRGGRLARALPELMEALQGDEHVIIESNSILAFLKPAVFLLVLDESQPDLKASARRFLGRADALVTIGSGSQLSIWPGNEMLKDKPIFSLRAGEWSNPALCRFVRERIALAAEKEIFLDASIPLGE